MIPVIDLFAGPGGLGEGFSSLKDSNGNHVFQTIMSVEMDSQAHNTLQLRAFFRRLLDDEGQVPRKYITFLKGPTAERLDALIRSNPEAWRNAQMEALRAELKENDNSLVELARKRLKEVNPSGNGPLVLIGGPPCQAYSLVGRSRRTHDREELEKDPKQTLYRCYLAFIEKLRPSVFIMENVKGLLSAKHHGNGVFDRIVEDMRDTGYEIRSLVVESPQGPKDYVVESERFGIPQARHRVILVGVENEGGLKTGVLQPRSEVTMRDVMAGIPRIRSGFSERNPGWRDINWKQYINHAVMQILKTPEGHELESELSRVLASYPPKVMSKKSITGDLCCYSEWYRQSLGNSTVLANHASRTHLAKDLDRYLFCAAFAEHNGLPAKLYDFPAYLLPEHKNARAAKSGVEIDFPDRFRVQLWNHCSTTITSHIHKDGHYYIHPDVEQCRSLTVREAARLQTFPDDYYFMGTRTSQYTQVGNAVPPLLARQIAEIVAQSLSVTNFEGFFKPQT